MQQAIYRFYKGICRKIKEFATDERGVGVVELILVLVVLIGLVVIFRDQLTSLMDGIFERIVNDSNAV